MRHWRRLITVGGLLAILCAVSTAAQGDLTDAYEILNRHYDACGGLDRLKAERTQYMEGTLSVAGLEGTLKAWIQKPDRSRAEVDLGILKMMQGDNGEYQWAVDANGKLQKITKPDEATIRRREVNRRLAEYEYADPRSDVFTVTLKGVEKVEGKDCYVIRIENGINNDVYTEYINSESFLLDKRVSIEAENSSDKFYGDYREIDGLKVAFRTRQVGHQTGQVEEVTVTKYLSNPEIERSLFDPPEEAGPDYHFVEGQSAENVPFRFIGNHIYVPVTVGCKERLWILDTGASMSVLGEKFAGVLGLTLQGEVKGRGAGGTVDVKLATLPPFSLQGINFDEQAVAVIDMAELVRFLGVDVAGILGYDFLSRFVTKIDYANEFVSFYDPETFEYTGGGREVDVHIKNRVFMVTATLDDSHSGTWMCDLGASSTYLDGAYALRRGFTEKKGVVALSRGAGNAFPTKKVKCRRMEFAGFTIDNPRIRFSYGGTDTVSTADEIGTLGNTLFRNFVVYCDYANERLILEAGDNFNQEFPEDNSGLQLARNEDGEFEVVFVADGTPAAGAGFREGDVLRSMNGIGVKRFDGLVAVREMLKEKPGTRYTFVVDRDGREKELQLKLANLF